MAEAAPPPNSLSTHKHPAMYILAQACVAEGMSNPQHLWLAGREVRRKGKRRENEGRGRESADSDTVSGCR